MCKLKLKNKVLVCTVQNKTYKLLTLAQVTYGKLFDSVLYFYLNNRKYYNKFK